MAADSTLCSEVAYSAKRGSLLTRERGVLSTALVRLLDKSYNLFLVFIEGCRR